MWLLPFLVLGVVAVVAASRSRETTSPSRQLPSPPEVLPRGAAIPPPPGPISVLGEILRVGQTPPPKVILCAIAEAESIGRHDLASDIVQTFIAPVVQAHARGQGFQRGTCAPSGSPRARADSCAPRGTCAPTGSPRAQADACVPVVAPGPGAAVPVPPPPVPPPSQTPAPRAPAQMQAPQKTSRYATQDEVLAMLHSDPTAFLKVMATGRPPMIEVPAATPVVTPVPQQTEPAPAPPIAVPTPPPAPPVPPAVESSVVDSVAAQLRQLPGFAGAGIVLVDPSSGAEVFEVSWLRGHPVPPMPPQFLGRPVRLAVVDSLPVPLTPIVVRVDPPGSEPVLQATGLPPETVAQMQEAAGLPQAADQTRAMAPGSPIRGVSDDAWRHFVVRLSREAPEYMSSRHVGQFRQRRERLAELGIDPRAIYGSATAQRVALDRDLADAHQHAADGGLVGEHLNRAIAVPGNEGTAVITLSGLLGVIQCAGLDGATGWLERPGDRKRYPHTTQAFLTTNGIF